MVDPQDRGQVIGMLFKLVEKGSMTIQYRIVRPDGEIRWLEDRVVVASGPEGRPVRFDGVASDITERKSHEAQLSYLATHDSLTQLPNRNLLHERITQSL
ncbi:MAG: PAS domain-containing protein [Gammaproteobacteria bacterium]